MSKSVNSVMVIGYGTMGRGILETFAKNGFEAAVLTRDPYAIKDLPAGADAYSELPDMAPDLIIESIPEDMRLSMDSSKTGRQIRRSSGLRHEYIRPADRNRRGAAAPQRTFHRHPLHAARGSLSSR